MTIDASLFLRISSAAFYGTASFMITVINKRILTVYKFPSFQVSLNDVEFLDTHLLSQNIENQKSISG